MAKEAIGSDVLFLTNHTIAKCRSVIPYGPYDWEKYLTTSESCGTCVFEVKLYHLVD